LLESLLFTRYRSFAACQWQKPLRGFHQGPCAPLRLVLFGCESLTVLSSIISHPSPFGGKPDYPGVSFVSFKLPAPCCFFRFLPCSCFVFPFRCLAAFPIRTSGYLSCRVFACFGFLRVVRPLRRSGFSVIRHAPRLSGKPSPAVSQMTVRLPLGPSHLTVLSYPKGCEEAKRLKSG
jgi:hypothetical protein